MIDKSKVKGVIFDYGGTLDTGADHWSWIIWDAYKDNNVGVSLDVFRDAYVYAERALAKTRYILPEHDFKDLMLVKIRLEFDWLVENGYLSYADASIKSYDVALQCYKVAQNKVNEAKNVLDKLSEVYPMVLVSNFYGNVESVLKDFDLSKYFPKIIESAVVGVRKPDPKIFELGVEALGLKPEEVVVIGDSYRKDIEPSEKIGCQTIWIKGKGWTPDEDEQTHPNSIYDINEVITQLMPN